MSPTLQPCSPLELEVAPLIDVTAPGPWPPAPPLPLPLLVEPTKPTPSPDVTIQGFTPFGPVLAVRPYCHNDHYWQVYFDGNMVIREVMGDSAFPGAAYPVVMQQARVASA